MPYQSEYLYHDLYTPYWLTKDKGKKDGKDGK